MSQWIAFLVALLCSTNAFGQAMSKDWRSNRFNGAGEAVTSYANDHTALFYNPGGFARSRNPRSRKGLHLLVVPEMELMASNSAFPVVEALFAGETQRALGKVFTAVREKPEEQINFDAQVFPAAIFGGKDKATWLVGVPMRSQNVFSASEADATQAEVTSNNTVTLALSFGKLSRAGTISWGISLRPNYRYSYFSRSYDMGDESIASFKNAVKNNAVKNFAFASDIGILLTAADFWLPTIGLAVRNLPTGCVEKYYNALAQKTQSVCGVLRSGKSSSSENDNQIMDPTEAKVGVSMTPRMRLGRQRLNFRFGVDFWPIPITISGKNYGLIDLPVDRLLHVGLEAFLGNPLRDGKNGLRVGYNNGDVTYGIAVEVFHINMSYSSFADERGGRNQMVGISLRF